MDLSTNINRINCQNFKFIYEFPNFVQKLINECYLKGNIRVHVLYKMKHSDNSGKKPSKY